MLLVVVAAIFGAGAMYIVSHDDSASASPVILVDPPAASSEAGQHDPTGTASDCVREQRTISVAIEAFYANFGRDASSLEELVSEGLLRTVPTRWVFQSGVRPTIKGIGDCDGL